MIQQEPGKCWHHKCLSWTAVFAGALVGIGLSFLLNIFNVSIGLSIFTTTANGAMSLAIGGFLALLIGIIVSMFLAGWVSGYLGRATCYKRDLGILYGFITWCLALILTILMMSQVGRYVSSFTHAIAKPTMIIVTDENDNAMSMKQTSSGNTEMTMSTDKAATSMGLLAFIVFVLFFVGAISSCVGATYGMSCGNECAWDNKPRV